MKERGTQLRPMVGPKAAGRPGGVARARYYRSRRPAPPKKHRRPPVRRLSAAQRARLHSERRPPRPIWATLLDAGPYRGPWRTRYRILRERDEIRERSPPRVPPPYPKPEWWAGAPNELWSGALPPASGTGQKGGASNGTSSWRSSVAR